MNCVKNILKAGICLLVGKKNYHRIVIRHWVKKLSKPEYDENHINILRKIVVPGSTCVDVGANMGQYTVKLAQLVGEDGMVFSFEPVGETYKLLKTIIGKFGFNNVESYNLGLGKTKEKLPISIPSYFGVPLLGLSHVRHLSSEKTKSTQEFVEFECLDNLKLGNSIISLIKIDVEGFEYNVIQGAKDTLIKHRPVLLIEIDPSMNSRLGLDASKTVSTLNADNYEMYVLDETKLCIKYDLVPGEVMYYFVPKEKSGIVKIINSSD